MTLYLKTAFLKRFAYVYAKKLCLKASTYSHLFSVWFDVSAAIENILY